ncbi:MAG: hypothetical protein KKB67_09015 [Alphaproteobacteria bacterium]|nr:hypothetical protein [Alphaproteobacteria bacterium]MBU0869885.1 hypothetical protein [Alphaproteobacteria bacterium]MBU1257479.1 hypothetical protein [Alphaproteobacteria bacterium]MBU1795103.1 hypothetical protein [Alphaproteobacteria bacterium]MBU2016617.1 hypothetical protein [Alphaproteobacteria bacterium]
MKLPPRKNLRPVKNSRVFEKKFNRLVETNKRVPKIVTAPIVVAELKRGSLDSLDIYLQANGGISDRLVALELRKLISGSVERSRYRLIVIEHPDAPKQIGGRPKNEKEAPSDRDWEIAARYEALLEAEGKAYLAKELVAQEFGLSQPTVVRAIRKVDRARKAAIELADENERRADVIRRRDEAFAKLRTASGRE